MTQKKIYLSARFIIFVILVLLIASCGKNDSDVRKFIPAESIAYVETNDLGAVLKKITDAKTFGVLAEKKPDLSALNGVKIAVGVTGFEAGKQDLTSETAALQIKPKFIAIIDSRLWSWQIRKFLDDGIGSFINDAYGGEVTMDVSEKHGTDFFTWTANDGRKAFAEVHGSLIFLSNDESALDKSLAVQRGEATGFAFPDGGRSEENIAAKGFITKDGVAQIANFAGISTAISSSEDEDTRSALAGFLPQLMRNSITDITWREKFTENGFADEYDVSLVPEIAPALAETLRSAESSGESAKFIPKNFYSATRYQPKNLQLAWRSVILTAAKQSDEKVAAALASLSDTLLEPYGVAKAENFLKSVSSVITVQIDAAGNDSIVIADVIDTVNAKTAISGVNFSAAAEQIGNAKFWRSLDGEFGVAEVDKNLIFGDAATVKKALEAGNSVKFAGSAVIETIGIDDSADEIVSAFGDLRGKTPAEPSLFSVTSTFSSKGMQRTTESGFGVIGQLVALSGAGK